MSRAETIFEHHSMVITLNYLYKIYPSAIQKPLLNKYQENRLFYMLKTELGNEALMNEQTDGPTDKQTNAHSNVFLR